MTFNGIWREIFSVIGAAPRGCKPSQLGISIRTRHGSRILEFQRGCALCGLQKMLCLIGR